MKTFYNLLANTLLASVTNYTVWFALIYFAYLQTGSVFVTSVVSGLYLVVVAFSGFWLGSIVDHNRKKTVMLASSVISLAIYIVGYFIYVTAAPDAFKDPAGIALWTLIPLLLLGVIAGNLRNIALPTLVTVLVPEEGRAKANGLVGTTAGISFMVVSVISGFMVAHSGMWLALVFAMTGSLLAIIHLAFIPVPEKEIIHTKNEDGTQSGKGIDLRGTIRIVRGVPGLLAIILFATFNNFLGGVFMSLMDAYGLTLVSVQVWGLIWGVLSIGFIVGGLTIAKFGLGKNPVRALFGANIVIWSISSVFTIQPSIWLLSIGTFLYMAVMPFIEASEQTVIQKVVPHDRQGRVFGFAQSVEMAASPLMAFLIGPLTQFFFIPLMTDGAGARLIGSWFGTGPGRGIALVFTVAGIVGLTITLLMMRSRAAKSLAKRYLEAPADDATPPAAAVSGQAA
jgi:DHA3 family multidrug efflux protein-like MFS transporter